MDFLERMRGEQNVRNRLYIFLFAAMAVIGGVAVYFYSVQSTEQMPFIAKSLCNETKTNSYFLEANPKSIYSLIDEIVKIKNSSSEIRPVSFERAVGECHNNLGFWFQSEDGNRFLYCAYSKVVVEYAQGECKTTDAFESIEDAYDVLTDFVSGKNSSIQR